MSVRQIRVVPDLMLRQKAKRVNEIDSSIHNLIDDMVDTMRAAPGVGLAANQVGIALRIIVIQLPEEDVIVLVNPEIIKKGGERTCQEGCLSVPGYQGEVKRSLWVKVKGLNSRGEKVRIKGEDLFRMRIGNYRVLFEKVSENKIRIIKIGHRKNIYKR